MNLVDWIIVGIVGVSVLIGLYRGFIASVASMGGSLVSLGASYWLTPKLVEYLQQHTGLASTLETYLDARTRLDTTTAGQSVAGLSSGSISDILSKVGLPAPLDTLLKTNLENQVFNAGQNVGEYVRQTIVGAAIGVAFKLFVFLDVTALLYIALLAVAIGELTVGVATSKRKAQEDSAIKLSERRKVLSKASGESGERHSHRRRHSHDRDRRFSGRTRGGL